MLNQYPFKRKIKTKKRAGQYEKVRYGQPFSFIQLLQITARGLIWTYSCTMGIVTLILPLKVILRWRMEVNSS